MSNKQYISNKDESVTMFANPLLNKLSRVHFTVPLILFLPVIGWLLYQSVIVAQHSLTQILLLFPAGIFVWSFVEYTIHRFVYHYHPTSNRGKRLHFICHGVHHDYPNDSWRLVMPPVLSIPLASFFYLLFRYLFTAIYPDATYYHPFMAGFLLGYLAYEMGHYAMHHLNLPYAWFKALRKHHLVHHFHDPDRGYGVSSPFWDVLFGTNTLDKRR